MRSLAALAVLALAACGQPEQRAAPAPVTASVPAEWVATLTASPRTLRTYDVSTFALEGTAGSVEQTATGARITTAAQLGAYGPVLDLGPETAGATPRVLRVNVEVEQGVLQFVMDYRNHAPNYTPHVQYVAAGEPTTIYLPADPNPGSLLIVANGQAGENVGVITSAELLSAP